MCATFTWEFWAKVGECLWSSSMTTALSLSSRLSSPCSRPRTRTWSWVFKIDELSVTDDGQGVAGSLVSSVIISCWWFSVVETINDKDCGRLIDDEDSADDTAVDPFRQRSNSFSSERIVSCWLLMIRSRWFNNPSIFPCFARRLASKRRSCEVNNRICSSRARCNPKSASFCIYLKKFLKQKINKKVVVVIY